jgi:hypothetical protein
VKIPQMTVALPGPERPLVALDVEPRLLHDALARALDEDGITIVDLRDDRCDIILTSNQSAAEARDELVVRVDPEGSSEFGVLAVHDLLAIIHRWEAGGSA